MKPIRVVVRGAFGRMGRETVNALCRETGIQLVGAVEIQVSEDSLVLPDASGTIPLSSDLNSILTSSQPDVMVDFTLAPAIMPAVQIATEKGVNLAILVFHDDGSLRMERLVGRNPPSDIVRSKHDPGPKVRSIANEIAPLVVERTLVQLTIEMHRHLLKVQFHVVSIG